MAKKQFPLDKLIAAVIALLAITVLSSTRAAGGLAHGVESPTTGAALKAVDDHYTQLVHNARSTGLATVALERIPAPRRSSESHTSKTVSPGEGAERSRILRVVRMRFEFALALAFASSGAGTTQTTSVPPPHHA